MPDGYNHVARTEQYLRMSTVKQYHCDHRDCDTWGRDLNVGGWFTVVWHGDDTKLHFCSSNCLLQGMAARTEPITEMEGPGWLA